ncbi:VOC family protein [Herbaspirillum hiltneri]|uniref:VOC family protein n=1 Tax=Herbaspirillum hiltneri TaxID=341045 RepID=UPI0009FB7DE2
MREFLKFLRDKKKRPTGVELRFCDLGKPWAGWHSADQAGNGQRVAFAAASRAAVRAAYEIALENDGACEEPPGLRHQYHANYYGAYFRDPEGNKPCVACHAPAFKGS